MPHIQFFLSLENFEKKRENCLFGIFLAFLLIFCPYNVIKLADFWTPNKAEWCTPSWKVEISKWPQKYYCALCLMLARSPTRMHPRPPKKSPPVWKSLRIWRRILRTASTCSRPTPSRRCPRSFCRATRCPPWSFWPMKNSKPFSAIRPNAIRPSWRTRAEEEGSLE